MPDTLREKITAVQQELSKVIRGKDEVIHLLLAAVAAGGSVLLEDVPGVGKTTLVRALGRALSSEFRRIQFTPDLLPGDILGGSVYNPVSGEMKFRPGAIFTNLLLADEINRASARTQSALLEAMSERQVSIEGRTYPLPDPFWVLATENPIEYQGTYSLPEAQLDRFAMRLTLGYPDEADELALLKDRIHTDPLGAVRPVMTASDVVALQNAVTSVAVNDSCAAYCRKLVAATRTDSRLRLGASPRALLALGRLVQAEAFLSGRDFATPADVKKLAPHVLPHRLVPLDRGGAGAGLCRSIVDEILRKTPVPR